MKEISHVTRGFLQELNIIHVCNWPKILLKSGIVSSFTVFSTLCYRHTSVRTKYMLKFTYTVDTEGLEEEGRGGGEE